MSTFFYTTGQAARELDTTQGQIRNLCQTGAIAAEVTAGGQWRIPKQEVERLKRDGLPVVPRPLPDRSPRLAKKNGGRELLLAPPSSAVAESAEAAAMSNHELQITRNRMEVLKLKKEAAEVGDFFEDRKRRRLDEEAAEWRRQEELADQQRQRETAELERQARREWLDKWLEYALGSLPYDAPADVRPDVEEHAEAALAKAHPGQSDYLVRQIVDGAVERALAPWRRNKEKQRAITDACENYRLPWDLRYREHWKHRVRQAATAAVEALPDTATEDRLKAEAVAAVAPLVREYEHQQACEKIVKDCWTKLPADWTSAESEDAEEAVKAALAALPVCATQREMERARDAALAPIQAAIAKRQADEHRREQEARRHSEAKKRIEYRLSHVGDYLEELDREEEFFEDGLTGLSERWKTRNRLKEVIQPVLLQELLKRPEMTDKQIERRIEQLIDEHLDDVLDELDEG